MIRLASILLILRQLDLHLAVLTGLSSNKHFAAELRDTMNAERFQIAVWLLMPIVSLFVLVLMIGARGAIFGLPLLVLLVLLIVAPIWYYQLRDPS